MTDQSCMTGLRRKPVNQITETTCEINETCGTRGAKKMKTQKMLDDRMIDDNLSDELRFFVSIHTCIHAMYADTSTIQSKKSCQRNNGSKMHEWCPQQQIDSSKQEAKTDKSE